MNGNEKARMQVTPSETLSPRLISMTIAGGLTFWAISVATSLLPIAAQYRAAFSNWSAQTVWIAALVIGMIISLCISNIVVRVLRHSPTKDPLVISLILGLVALALATIIIDLPRSINGTDRNLHYFLIGLGFNSARFLGLGAAIGYPFHRQWASTYAPGRSAYKGDGK